MGRWGMGMTECDEFLEVYDSFMERYDRGMEIADVTSAILSEYASEFDEGDGVMHEVYFAIAKAEWTCGEISEDILERVRYIIESGSDIAFLKSLDATDKDIAKREENLKKFLAMLEKPKRTNGM